MSATTYTGSCHCGKVRYQAQVDLGRTPMTCNCSICSRTGAIMTFVPASDVSIETGADELTEAARCS